MMEEEREGCENREKDASEGGLAASKIVSADQEEELSGERGLRDFEV
jgi:hypothetical protein